MKRRVLSPFQASLRYIRESRFYILAAVVLFVASALFSFLLPSFFTGFDETLRDLALRTEGLSALQLFFFILQNNLMSSFFALFFGVLAGVVPFFNALLNGAVLGYVISRVAPLAGWGVLWRLLPHGIFELPAIFISLGLGLRLGCSLFSRAGRRLFNDRLASSFRVFLCIVVPLLFVAAFIEALLIAFF